MAESEIGNLLAENIALFDKLCELASEKTGVDKARILVSTAFFDLQPEGGGRPIFTYSFVDAMDKSPLYYDGRPLKAQFGVQIDADSWKTN